MMKRRRLDRAQVVAAATELADAHGLEALTLAALAKKLEIRIPSLYNHIDGLAGLRREIGLKALGDLENLLTRAAAGRQGAEALQAVAEAYYGYAKANPGGYLAAQRPADSSDAEMAAAGTRVVDLLHDVMRPFGLSDRERIHAVRGFRSLVHGFVSLNAAGGFGLPVDVGRSLRQTLNWYLNGLRSSTGRESAG